MRSLKTGSLSSQICSSHNTAQTSTLQRQIDVSSRCRALALSPMSGRNRSFTQIRKKHSTVPIPEPARAPQPVREDPEEVAPTKKQYKRILESREYKTDVPFRVRKVVLDTPSQPEPATLAEHYQKSTLLKRPILKITKLYNQPQNAQTSSNYLPSAQKLNNYHNASWAVNRDLFNEEFYDEIIMVWFNAIQRKWLTYTDMTLWDNFKTHDRFAPFRKYDKHLQSLMFQAGKHPSMHKFISMAAIYEEANQSPKSALAWMIFLSRVPSVVLHDTKEAALVPTHFDHLAANLARLFQRLPLQARPDLCHELRPYPWFRIWFYTPFQGIEDYEYCRFAAQLITAMHKEASSDKEGILFEKIQTLDKMKAMSWKWLSMVRDLKRNPWNNAALGRKNTPEEEALFREKAQLAQIIQQDISNSSGWVLNVAYDIPSFGMYPFNQPPKLRKSPPVSNSRPDEMQKRGPRILMGSSRLPPVTSVESTTKGPKVSLHWFTPDLEPSGVSPYPMESNAWDSFSQEVSDSSSETQSENTGDTSPLATNPLGEGNFDDLWDTVVPQTKTFEPLFERQRPIRRPHLDNLFPMESDELGASPPARYSFSDSKPLEERTGERQTMGTGMTGEIPIRRTPFDDGKPSSLTTEFPATPKTETEVDTLEMLAELRKDLQNRRKG